KFSYVIGIVIFTILLMYMSPIINLYNIFLAARLFLSFPTRRSSDLITEQVHRARELRRRRATTGSWLEQAAKLIEASDVPVTELATAARQLAVRPVFTAHPTEAARRSILSKLRAIADELDAEAATIALYGGNG